MPTSPDWLSAIRWEPPHTLASLIANKSAITDHPGYYAFTPTGGPLLRGNVFYVGETGQAGGIRARVRNAYLINDPRSYKGHHQGCLFILDQRLKRGDANVWMHWSPAVFTTHARQEIEMALMQYYQADFNTRGYFKSIPYDTD